MEESRYKKYEDCNLDELEQIKKLDIRKKILGAVKEAKLVIEKRLKK